MKQSRIQHAMEIPLALFDGFLNPSLEEDQELARRGRLQVRLGVLGGAFAILYSTFFFVIGHFWGGCIVATCGLAIMQLPWIVKRSGNLLLTGHLFGAILLTGFAGLGTVGGGLQGHANAWLASVPVTVLLIMNVRGAITWSALTFATVVGFATLDMAGVKFFRSYDPYWEPSIEAASHIGLLIYLSLMGLLFEQTRIEAFERLMDANEKLSEANENLADLNKQKNEFLNIAAHDLKNPLTIICGYADILRELKSPTLEQIRDQSAEILRSGNHMLDIITTILQVRALEDGEVAFQRERCHTTSLIEKVVAHYQPAAGQKNIGIVFSPSDQIPDAWSDTGATHKIIDHLVSNAVKYTPCEGSVTIRQSISEEFLVIEVMDTGPGLSKEDQAKLWTKFARLTPKPTGDEKTNGLGLWIVKHLAEKMGGNAFCRSAPGQGSIFGVSLPLWSHQDGSATEESETDSAKRSEAASAFHRLIGAKPAKRAFREESVALPS